MASGFQVLFLQGKDFYGITLLSKTWETVGKITSGS